MIAIALNTSIIDLLTKDGSPLTVADGVDPLPPSWLDGWLRGETPWPAWQAASSALCSASEARSTSQSSEQCCLAPSRSTSPAPMPSRLAFGHGATFAMAVSAGLAVAAFGLVFGLPRRSSGSPQMPPRNSARARAPTRLLWRSRPQPVGPRGHTPELSWRDPDGTGAGHART